MVKVKKLEWEEVSAGGRLRAETVAGVYHILGYPTRYSLYPPYFVVNIGVYGTIEEAKEKGQEHFDNLILSAIDA